MKTIRMGTRRSPLALWQAQHAVQRLQQHYPHTNYQLVPMVTEGDKTLGALHKAGGKGLFSKDIHQAMLRGDIDCAVHSLKDVEVVCESSSPWHSAHQDERIDVCAVWQAGTTVDVLVSRTHDIQVVASDSNRRRDQLSMMYPHVRFVSARGNVGTRLALVSGDVDATVLAGAGLQRLGLWGGGDNLEPPFQRLFATPLTCMVPAAGQGVLAMDALQEEIKQHIAKVSDAECAQYRWIERRVLQLLKADCHTSIGLETGLEGVRWFYKGVQGFCPHLLSDADTAFGLYQHLDSLKEP